jgi:hypothetical protein
MPTIAETIPLIILAFAAAAHLLWPRGGTRHQEGRRVNPTRRGVIE